MWISGWRGCASIPSSTHGYVTRRLHIGVYELTVCACPRPCCVCLCIVVVFVFVQFHGDVSRERANKLLSDHGEGRFTVFCIFLLVLSVYLCMLICFCCGCVYSFAPFWLVGWLVGWLVACLCVRVLMSLDLGWCLLGTFLVRFGQDSNLSLSLRIGGTRREVLHARIMHPYCSSMYQLENSDWHTHSLEQLVDALKHSRLRDDRHAGTLHRHRGRTQFNTVLGPHKPHMVQTACPGSSYPNLLQDGGWVVRHHFAVAVVGWSEDCFDAALHVDGSAVVLGPDKPPFAGCRRLHHEHTAIRH